MSQKSLDENPYTAQVSPAAEKKKSPKWPWFLAGGIFLVILIFFVVIILVAIVIFNGLDSKKSKGHSDTVKVEVIVTATDKGIVRAGSYSNGGSSTSEFTREWRQEKEIKRKDGYDVSVRPDTSSKKNTDSTVTCKILVDGEVVDEQSATGSHSAEATCKIKSKYY